MRYAIVIDGVVMNVTICNEAAYAAAMGWVLVPTFVNVGIGWTYDGTNWDPPAPEPPTALQTASQTVMSLADEITYYLAQAQTDAEALNTLLPGEPLASEHVIALQHSQEGWVTLLTGLQALLTSLGI